MSSDEGATRKNRARTESSSTPVWPREQLSHSRHDRSDLFGCRPVGHADDVTEPELVAIR